MSDVALRIEPSEASASLDRARELSNTLSGAFHAPIVQPVVFYDNTLREGEQAPGAVFSADDKLEIARLLDAVGVHWANLGMPAVSSQERKAIERIVGAGLKMKTAVLSRCRPDDIEASVATGVDMVSLFLGVSDTHLRDKLRIAESDAWRLVADSVAAVKRRDRMAAFTVEDGSRTPLDRILKAFEVAQEAGADVLVFADTVGVMTPSSIHRVIALLVSSFRSMIGLHLHDDLGLSLANALAGLEGGASQAHVTVNGVGERAGNTALEELAVALRLKYDRDLGLALDRLTELCDRVHRCSGTEPPPHKPITGRWSFTHESGIHVAGVLANPETYEPYPPSLVGRHHEVVFGKHSGAQSVNLLAGRLGVTLSKAAQSNVLDRIKALAEERKALVPVELVRAWILGEE